MRKALGDRLKKVVKFTGIGFGALGGLGVVAGTVISFNDFSDSLDGYYGVKMSDTRAEVHYRLGEPLMVSDGEGKEFFNGTAEGTAPIPTAKTINDFSRWKYRNMGALIAVDFAKEKVEAVSCLEEVDSDRCSQIAGVGSRTTEERLLSVLGKPSKTRVSDGSKTFKYEDLGVSYGLIKGEVIATQMRARPTNKWARFVRWSFFRPKA